MTTNQGIRRIADECPVGTTNQGITRIADECPVGTTNLLSLLLADECPVGTTNQGIRRIVCMSFALKPKKIRVIPMIRGQRLEQTGSFGSLATKLHYQVNGRCRTADLCHEADGMIRFLAILTALYQNRALSPLTIEEPEKAIFPRALGL